VTQSIPPLTWFRAFESAARHLNFTKAARELNLTQSAVSQHVRALESKFGCNLFIRQPRGLALTDHGRRLLPSVSIAVAALSAAAATFEISGEKKVLTIAASSSISQLYITPYLKLFVDQHPGVAVRLSTKTWPDEFFGLDADLEIRFDSEQSGHENSKLLEPNEMVVVASPKFLETQNQAAGSPNNICEYPLIQVIGTNDTWQVWADAHQIEKDLDIAAYVESHGVAVELAKSDFGVAYTNKFIAAPAIQSGALVELGKAPISAKDGYYLSIKQGQNTALAHAFSDWLKTNMGIINPILH